MICPSLSVALVSSLRLLFLKPRVTMVLSAFGSSSLRYHRSLVIGSRHPSLISTCPSHPTSLKFSQHPCFLPL